MSIKGGAGGLHGLMSNVKVASHSPDPSVPTRFAMRIPILLQSVLPRVLLLALLSMTSALQAAALGEVTVHSALGQKLDADIEIVALTQAELETLAVRPASREAFAEANLEMTPAVRSLRFEIQRKGQRTVVHLTSEQAVNDPYLTILFELESDGNRMMRQYALLLDPPAVEDSAVAVTDVQTAAQPATAASVVVSAPVGPLAAAETGKSSAEKLADTHTVRRGDTLAKIAVPLRAAVNAQLEQVLVAMQRANPDAFVGKNINRIKTGSVLKLPDADAIKAIDADAARKLVQAQTADFDRYRNSLAQQARSEAAAEAQNAEVTHSSSGKIGVQVVESGTENAAKDKLVLSAAGAASDQNAAAAKLDKIASDKAAAEAKSRIASLEKNVSDMQQLLEMKNKTLAEMQSKPATAVTPAAPEVKPEVKSEVSPELNPEVKAEAKPELSPGVKPDVKSAATPVMAEVTMADWLKSLLQNPLARPLAGGVSLLLLGLLLLRARRRRQARYAAGNPSATEPAPKSTSLLDIAGGRDVDTSNSVFHSNFVPSVSQLDTNEVDAVAEADVYIAYGRDEQAEEILQDALRTHPERNALRVKLLEIYATRKDVQKFGKLAADLYGITHGTGDEWMQAAQLGQMLEPANLLYSAARRSDVPEAKIEPSLKLVGGDFDLSGISLELEPIAASNDPATHALNNKLDLALACKEIGDKDGARELLSEVASSNNTGLATKAKSLLRQLA